MITNNGRFNRNPDFVYRKVIEETILVPVHMNVTEMDCIYTLNEIGAFIWEQLETPLSFEQLTERLLDEYDVDHETLATDLETFLDEMQSIGAIVQEEYELPESA